MEINDDGYWTDELVLSCVLGDMLDVFSLLISETTTMAMI